MIFKSKENDEGFTMVEVMVSFVIMAGAIVMVLQVFGGGLHSLNASQMRARETELAQQQIDQISLAGQLKEGQEVIEADGHKMRIIIDRLEAKDLNRFYLLFPFRVGVFQDNADGRSDPILETILLSKLEAP